MRTRSTFAAIAVAAAAGLAGCSGEVSVGDKTVDTEKGEEVIGGQLTEQLGGKVTVDCPEKVDAEKGATFDCKATNASGETATVLVTQKDDKGNIRWEIKE